MTSVSNSYTGEKSRHIIITQNNALRKCATAIKYYDPSSLHTVILAVTIENFAFYNFK